MPAVDVSLYIYSLHTQYHELAARRAIRALEGNDIENVSEYIDYASDRYKKMAEWIAKDLEVTTLRYQTVDEVVEAIGLPKERLCLYCWMGECPASGSGSKKRCAGVQ